MSEQEICSESEARARLIQGKALAASLFSKHWTPSTDAEKLAEECMDAGMEMANRMQSMEEFIIRKFYKDKKEAQP
tara:strand:+ start:1434 stop:1661 length:228 start_codon:yes stop_codon:yes gene_type:complete